MQCITFENVHSLIVFIIPIVLVQIAQFIQSRKNGEGQRVILKAINGGLTQHDPPPPLSPNHRDKYDI